MILHKVQRVFADWSARLAATEKRGRLCREEYPLLIFFHGYSLAHTIRPLVMARELRHRGYPVEFAGTGPYRERIESEGFAVHNVVTMPQTRMDDYVARCDYGYYDMDWINRCVESERTLVRRVAPELLICDMKPTAELSSACEGVDLAKIGAGYNQPGYPFHIPLVDGFSTSIGPFDVYAQQIEGELKEHKQLYLLADVPEFHPPSPFKPAYYHYVGPLIEGSYSNSRVIDDLDWDCSLPLIYVTCGSSGKMTAHIERLIEQAVHRPYRLLLTTAGRWSGIPSSKNVRIIDYAPADLILKQAALLICTGGIGTIYHALRHGVPIIGAPEHLDQEYHLNRVRDLGLGIKLDKMTFQAEYIWNAVDRLFNEYETFKRCCQAFAPYVKAWKGGEAAADIIDQYFLERQGSNIHPVTAMREEEFVHYLNLSTPPELSPHHIRTMLRRGCRRGMPHKRQEGILLFDKLHSWNWLYDHDPEFFESDYRSLEQKRDFFLSRDSSGKIESRRDSQTYQLQFTYRAFPHSLAPGQKALLFLPFPIHTPFQGPVQLISCTPPQLKDYLLPSFGFFYSYPLLRSKNKDEVWEYKYTCEVTIKERRFDSAVDSQGISETEMSYYLQLDIDELTTKRIREALQEISIAADVDDQEKARVLYYFLLNSKRFKKTLDWEQTLESCTEKILKDNGGHCTSLIYAFIALCRSVGIPAREITGTLVGYPSGQGQYQLSSYKEGGLCAHTWAEIFLKGKGWIPVEFHSIAIGENTLTEDNVLDPLLRLKIHENTALYRDYYFGNLDPHHIVYSNSTSKKIPLCLVEDPNVRWKPADFPYECTLNTKCL